jgi:Amt family ammonium transporter
MAKGALDYAGGTVVHINAGVAGLVVSLVLGKRIGWRKEPMAPHNLVLALMGASFLWVGWFGFNGGSGLAADARAVMAIVVSQIAAAAAALAWMACEYIQNKRFTVLGTISGAIAGLVAITPASGFVEPMASLWIGIAGGVICYFGATWLKYKLGYDDSLDAFGVHGIGGIVGALLTGVFVSPAITGEAVKPMIEQLLVQGESVVATIIYSALVTFILIKIVDKLIGIRVSKDEEREGLDLSLHGERVE